MIVFKVPRGYCLLLLQQTNISLECDIEKIFSPNVVLVTVGRRKWCFSLLGNSLRLKVLWKTPWSPTSTTQDHLRMSRLTL